MKPLDKHEELCPKCGSDNVDYKSIIPEDGLILLPKVCIDCGHESEEVYQLKYLRTDS